MATPLCNVETMHSMLLSRFELYKQDPQIQEMQDEYFRATRQLNHLVPEHVAYQKKIINMMMCKIENHRVEKTLLALIFETAAISALKKLKSTHCHAHKSSSSSKSSLDLKQSDAKCFGSINQLVFHHQIEAAAAASSSLQLGKIEQTTSSDSVQGKENQPQSKRNDDTSQLLFHHHTSAANYSSGSDQPTPHHDASAPVFKPGTRRVPSETLQESLFQSGFGSPSNKLSANTTYSTSNQSGLHASASTNAFNHQSKPSITVQATSSQPRTSPQQAPTPSVSRAHPVQRLGGNLQVPSVKPTTSTSPVEISDESDTSPTLVNNESKTINQHLGGNLQVPSFKPTTSTSPVEISDESDTAPSVTDDQQLSTQPSANFQTLHMSNNAQHPLTVPQPQPVANFFMPPTAYPFHQLHQPNHLPHFPVLQVPPSREEMEIRQEVERARESQWSYYTANPNRFHHPDKVALLEDWYQRNRNSAYAEGKDVLAVKTGLTRQQVLKWLNNRRGRDNNTKGTVGRNRKRKREEQP